MVEEKEAHQGNPTNWYQKQLVSKKKEFVEAGNKQLEILKDLTIKTITILLLLNGGAAVACMGFLSSLSTKNILAIAAVFREPLFCFAFGAMAAVLISGFAYLSQSYYCKYNDCMIDIIDRQEHSLLLLGKIIACDKLLSKVSVEASESILRTKKGIENNKSIIDKDISRSEMKMDKERIMGDTFRDICITSFFISIFLFIAGVIKMGNLVLGL